MTLNSPQAPRAGMSDGSLRVVVIYAVFAGLWILFSDAAVGFLFQDPEIITIVSTLKGWLFVAVTSLLLYVLVSGLVSETLEYSAREQAATLKSVRTAQLLEAIVDSSTDSIFAKDRDGNYLLFNRETARITGMDSGEVLGKDDRVLLPPEQLKKIRANDQLVMTAGRVNSYEEVVSTVNGERVFLSTKGPLRDREGHVIGMYGISRDITERKLAEETLRENEERLRLALKASSQGWFDIDLRSGKVGVSDDYVRLIGYDPRDFESTIENWMAQVYPEDRERLSGMLDHCAEDSGPFTLEYRRRTRDGQWRWIRSVGKVVQRDEHQAPLRIIGVHTDITEWKQMEDSVRQLAFYDALTGLPNRRLLNDRLAQAMAASKRSGCYCALMFLDLDNFKPLNDTHGHEAGDLLLIEVAERMRSCVREVDTVARFGGDEFVVMVSELEREDPEASAAMAHAVADKIRVALACPYVLSVPREGMASLSVEHHCSASIGIALFVNHVFDAGEILKRADLAMYEAKEAGRNTIRFFMPHP